MESTNSGLPAADMSMAEKPSSISPDVAVADRGHGARFHVKFGRIGAAVGVTKLG